MAVTRGAAEKKRNSVLQLIRKQDQSVGWWWWWWVGVSLFVFAARIKDLTANPTSLPVLLWAHLWSHL
jgi:hypothetical protein